MTHDSNTWLALPQFAAVLAEFCQQRRTGTSIGFTEQNHMFVVAVQNGAIVGLSFKTTAGLAALPDIQAVSRCKFNFKDKVVLRTDADLPTTAEILQALGLVAPSPTGTISVPQPQSTTADVSSSEGGMLSTTAMRAVIEKEAGRLLGPVAGMLVEEQLENGLLLRTRDDLRQLLRAVASAAGEPQLTGQLITRVMKASGLEQRTDANT